MACRWRTDQETGLRFHVPECWGTVHDPDGVCICSDRMPDNEEWRERMSELEDALMDLRRDVAALHPRKGEE